VCIRDGFLYTLRGSLGDENTRVYLAPLGSGDLKAAFENIFGDAASEGKKTSFISLTEKKAETLEMLFPGRFSIDEDRNIAEYVYRTDVMSRFPGTALKKRRHEVHLFWHIYEGRASVEMISGKDAEDILRFEHWWVKENSETHDVFSLEREARMIEKQMAHFDELHLSGVVVRIDGAVRGFGYGTKLSDLYYDAIAEKGDRNVTNIYKVLRMESVRQCAMDCRYVNIEEDVGVEGLRALKNNYKPDHMLRKYIATER
jgi:hypothetical protein